MVDLTEKQIVALKEMIDLAKDYSEATLQAMQESRINEIPGARLEVIVDPGCSFTVRVIKFGQSEESGHIEMAKGWKDNDWSIYGKNSTEYEILFGRPETVRRIKEMLQAEKPLPPDGLWISRYDDPPVLDDRRDVNAEADQRE